MAWGGMRTAQEQLTRHYGEGVRDGMEMVVQMLLGKSPCEGVDPAPQPLTGELRLWAEAALRRLETMKAEARERG